MFTTTKSLLQDSCEVCDASSDVAELNALLCVDDEKETLREISETQEKITTQM